MATQDLSRRTFDPRYNRRQVLGQVGRVITDEDLTQIGDITADELSADRVGIIGPHGSSNTGFRISNVDTTGGVINFTVEAGDYWIGGHRATLREAVEFRLQPDWLQRPEMPAPNAARHDLVVLELFTQAVSAVEQEASADPGLGGPDSAAHMRLMARVRLVEDLPAGACHDLWEATLSKWQAAGQGALNPATHELASDALLRVGFTNEAGVQDLCAPDIQDGFLGAANRAIRVQMTSANSFCWGFENGGRLMRASVSADRAELTLLTDPWDEAHWPSADQVIEVLPWGAVDFNGEKLASEGEGGHFTKVASGYNPDTGVLTLAEALPAGFNTAWHSRPDRAALETTRFGAQDQAPFVFVRVWDRGEDRTSPAEMPVAAGSVLGLTGLTLTHSGTPRTGEAWVIAARPFAPDDIAPWELRVNTAPSARRRFAAPLARLAWDAAGGVDITDCRARFRPLTRQNDCVTLRVGDGSRSHGDYTRIQDAVEALPVEGGRILLLPGDYDEHVLLSQRDNIHFEGCGVQSRVVPASGADIAADDTAVFTLEGCRNITLKNFAIEAPAQLGVAAISKAPALAEEGQLGRAHCENIALHGLTLTHFQRGGAWLAACTGATVEQCLFVADGTLDGRALAEKIHRPSLFIQGRELVVRDNTLTAMDFGKPLAPTLGGLIIGGGSSSVQVAQNLIEGCYGNGITLGSVIYVPQSKIGSDAELTATFQRYWGTVYIIDTFKISDDNCFGLDPVPPAGEPNDPDPLVPVPDGALYDITIRHNRIRNMGGNGIGVARYFNLDQDPFLITVEDMLIERNEISGVLNGENLPFPAEMQLVAAWAGIALADITRVEIRENRIISNSRKHSVPAVGIFALYAEDTEIVENTIADNGLRVDEINGDGPGLGGWRGGIVITQVRPSPRDIERLAPDDGPIRSDGSCALVVHGNSVRAPQGRALTAFGLGPMHITDNRLVSQSGATDGFILAGFNLRRFGQLSLAGLLVNSLFVALQQGQRPNASAGHLILSIMGGDVVALANMGVSNEIYMQLFGLGDRLISGDQELGFDAPGELMVGGDIMLNNNQIRLDGLDGISSFGISAVALASLDNVMVQSNQISLDLDVDFMGMNLLALGFTVHASSNRLKEPLFNCFVSALSLAVMNTTALNQATHCVLPFGPNIVRYNQGNTELVEVIEALTGDKNEVELCSRMRGEFTRNFKEDLAGLAGFFSSTTKTANTEN